MHTPVCQNTFAFLCNCFILIILRNIALGEKKLLYVIDAEYAAHVFYLVILALRILDDIS